MNQVLQGWEKKYAYSIDSHKFPGKINNIVLDPKFIIERDWVSFVSPTLLGPSLQTIEPAVGDSSESLNLCPLAWKREIYRY